MVTRCLGRTRGGWPVVERAGAGLAPSRRACALAATPGVAEQRLDSDGRQRSYRLFVPQSYDGRTPLALVLDLHGSGGTAAGAGRHEPLRSARYA